MSDAIKNEPRDTAVELALPATCTRRWRAVGAARCVPAVPAFPLRYFWSSARSGAAHGKVMVKAAPAPGSLSAVIVPPWAVTIDRAMYRPSPSPP